MEEENLCSLCKSEACVQIEDPSIKKQTNYCIGCFGEYFEQDLADRMKNLDEKESRICQI